MELVYVIANDIAVLSSVGMVLYSVLVYMLLFFKKKTWLRKITPHDGMEGFWSFIVLFMGIIFSIGCLIKPASGGFSVGFIILVVLTLCYLVYLSLVKISSWRDKIPES
jgi:hypothetical protein